MQAAHAAPFSAFGRSALLKSTADEPLAVYDEPEAWAAFTQSANSQQSQNNANTQNDTCQSFVLVKGMHCAACALSLEAALLSVNGVLSAQVSATSASASVTWLPALTRPSIWMGAGLALGYEVFPAEDAFSFDKDRQQSRLALWRWLVAGFCMMQVMMYAAPAYFTQPGDISPDIEKLLRWASWVLTLPVVMFSCKPFFSNAWRDLLHRSISMDLPVAIGIVVTFAVSCAATFEPQGWWGRAVYFDSLTMFVFFLLTGRWLEQRLRARTAGALGALMQRLPVSVERQLPGDEFERVAVRRLRAGDVVRVLPGEAFPADGIVLDGATFADEALLTGESQPVTRDVGDAVMAGSFNLGNAVLVRISQLGTATRYAQIVALMAQAALGKPRLAVLADKVAKPFLVFVLLAALGAAVYGWRADPAMALMAAVAVLVVTCPCALSLATPTAMLTTAGLLASQGVLVRRLQAIESMADIDTVIFDKTGTLTEADMRLMAVHTRDGFSHGAALQWAASLARQSLHPVARALVAASGDRPALTAVNVKEFAGLGLQGAIDDKTFGSHNLGGLLRLGSSKFCEIKHAGDVVGRVHLADSQGWIATFDFAEALRPDAAETITALRASGRTVYMLSGDTQTRALQVAAQLGIAQVKGDCTPEIKLALLKALQVKGHKVMMVGDGLNDGPILAAAHVSVAVGSAVPLAQAQSDLVMPSAQLFMLPTLLLQAKRTLRIVKQNLLWAAIYNATCVPLAIAGFMPAWLAGLGMATSSLLVMANAARLSHFKAAK